MTDDILKEFCGAILTLAKSIDNLANSIAADKEEKKSGVKEKKNDHYDHYDNYDHYDHYDNYDNDNLNDHVNFDNFDDNDDHEYSTGAGVYPAYDKSKKPWENTQFWFDYVKQHIPTTIEGALSIRDAFENAFVHNKMSEKVRKRQISIFDKWIDKRIETIRKTTGSIRPSKSQPDFIEAFTRAGYTKTDAECVKFVNDNLQFLSSGCTYDEYAKVKGKYERTVTKSYSKEGLTPVNRNIMDLIKDKTKDLTSYLDNYYSHTDGCGQTLTGLPLYKYSPITIDDMPQKPVLIDLSSDFVDYIDYDTDDDPTQRNYAQAAE